MWFICQSQTINGYFLAQNWTGSYLIGINTTGMANALSDKFNTYVHVVIFEWYRIKSYGSWDLSTKLWDHSIPDMAICKTKCATINCQVQVLVAALYFIIVVVYQCRHPIGSADGTVCDKFSGAAEGIKERVVDKIFPRCCLRGRWRKWPSWRPKTECSLDWLGNTKTMS